MQILSGSLSKLPAVWVWVLAASAGALSLKVQNTAPACVSSAKIRRAIKRVELPGPAPLKIRLRLAPHGDDFRVRLHLQVNQNEIRRNLPLISADCSLLPRLLTAIVRRFVRELPSGSFALPPAIPPPTISRIYGPDPPLYLHGQLFEHSHQQSTQRLLPPLRWQYSLAAGGSIGLDSVAPQARLQLKNVWSKYGPIRFLLVVEGEAVAPQQLGEGQAYVLGASGGLGAGWLLAEEPQLAIDLWLSGGSQMSQGIDFPQNRRLFHPLLRSHLSLSTVWWKHLYAALDVSADLARLELQNSETEDRLLLPRFRAALFLGYTQEVRFW